jgi:hypothetical protein
VNDDVLVGRYIRLSGTARTGRGGSGAETHLLGKGAQILLLTHHQGG